MDRLSNPQKTLEIIQKHDFTFQKRFGQNFLVDSHVLDKIVAASGVEKEDCVVEIGPGIGTLTQVLAERAGRVVAVEIDRMLIPILQETLRDYTNVVVINRDILQTDLEQLAQEYNGGRPVRIVANLPYYITTPIIMELLEKNAPVRSITVMVQKEVADRMRSGPGSKDYGALSLAVQYYACPRIAALVPPNCFIPRPKVPSAVIHLELYGEKPVKVSDEKHMFRLIRASFNQRRKTLANAVSHSPELPYSREDILQVLEKLEISATIRGEALSLEQFALLSDELEAGRSAGEDDRGREDPSAES